MNSESERGGEVKECTTHHHACDCREEATRRLVIDLLGTDKNWKSLRAEAERLGYVQARSDRPAAQGENKTA
jgi:hypothetical protein